MSNRVSKLLMAFGMVLIVSAASLVAYNYQDARTAEATAQRVLQQVEAQIPKEPLETAAPGKVVAVAVENGRSSLGVLEIPALDLTLPVLSDWSYSNLKLAPCRYWGSISESDLILAAHNYPGHFGELETLQIGDVVTFTDVDKVTYSYRVCSLETINGYDVNAMTSGGWDLTLFTCTTGGQQRVTVRCKLAV